MAVAPGARGARDGWLAYWRSAADAAGGPPLGRLELAVREKGVVGSEAGGLILRGADPPFLSFLLSRATSSWNPPPAASTPSPSWDPAAPPWPALRRPTRSTRPRGPPRSPTRGQRAGARPRARPRPRAPNTRPTRRPLIPGPAPARAAAPPAPPAAPPPPPAARTTTPPPPPCTPSPKTPCSPSPACWRGATPRACAT